MAKQWPEALPVIQVRIARPTARLDKMVEFYRDGIGMPIIYSYTDDADYDGVMFGLPSRHYNLEISYHKGDGPGPVPSRDTLLVLYIPDQPAIDRVVKRLETMGYRPGPPRNPYWAAKGVTIVDPDGWCVVLMNSHGFGETYDAM